MSSDSAQSAGDLGDHPFLRAFRGSFVGMLRWHQLDALWERLRERTEAGWYLYAVGEEPPRDPVVGDALIRFIEEIDQLLRREHDESYCGIVYADSAEAPTLGVSCGYSENPPLPGWILSTLPPCDLPAALPPPGGRRRWWRRLFT